MTTPKIARQTTFSKSHTCEFCVAYKNNTCPEIAAFVELMFQFSDEEKVDFTKMTPAEYTEYYIKLVNDYDEYHQMYPALKSQVIRILTEL